MGGAPGMVVVREPPNDARRGRGGQEFAYTWIRAPSKSVSGLGGTASVGKADSGFAGDVLVF